MKKNAADVYSQALFEVALKRGGAEEISRELAALAELAAGEERLVRLLDSTVLDFGQKRRLLTEIFGGRILQTTLDFICVLAESRRFGELAAVADAFRARYNEANNITEVSITTAIPLTDDMRARLLARLSRIYKREVALSESIDPKIIGGMIISHNGIVTDGSVRGELTRLKKSLSEREV